MSASTAQTHSRQLRLMWRITWFHYLNCDIASKDHLYTWPYFMKIKNLCFLASRDSSISWLVVLSSIFRAHHSNLRCLCHIFCLLFDFDPFAFLLWIKEVLLHYMSGSISSFLTTSAKPLLPWKATCLCVRGQDVDIFGSDYSACHKREANKAGGPMNK